MKERLFLVAFTVALVRLTAGQDIIDDGSGESSEHSDCADADLMFLLDTSGSIRDIFDAQKQLAVDLVQRLPSVDRRATRIGVIQFAGYPLVNFGLSRYMSAEAIQRHLGRMIFLSGVTRTAKALQSAREILLGEDDGGRTNSRKVIIVMTDGLSFDNPLPIARQLRTEDDVAIFVVSLAPDAFKPELEGIAGTMERVFYLDEKAAFLDTVAKHIMDDTPCTHSAAVEEGSGEEPSAEQVGEDEDEGISAEKLLTLPAQSVPNAAGGTVHLIRADSQEAEIVPSPEPTMMLYNTTMMLYNSTAEEHLYNTSMLYSTSTMPAHLYNLTTEAGHLYNITTVMPHLYNTTMDPSLYNTTMNSALYNITMDPALYNTTMDPTLYNSTMDPSLYNTTMDPALYNSTMDPALYNSTMDPALYNSTMDPALYNATMDPTLYNITMDPLLYNTTMDPALYNTTVHLYNTTNKEDPTVEHLYNTTEGVANLYNVSMDQNDTVSKNVTAEQLYMIAMNRSTEAAQMQHLYMLSREDAPVREDSSAEDEVSNAVEVNARKRSSGSEESHPFFGGRTTRSLLGNGINDVVAPTVPGVPAFVQGELDDVRRNPSGSYRTALLGIFNAHDQQPQVVSLPDKQVDEGDRKKLCAPVDLFFLLDSSGVDTALFDRSLEFVRTVAGHIDLRPQAQRLALMQFADASRQRLELPFSELQSADLVDWTLERITQLGGSTAIGAAMGSALETLARRRQPRPQTWVVVLSDGHSQDDAVPAARTLRQLTGATVFAVGLGDSNDKLYLRELTGSASRVFVGREAALFHNMLQRRFDGCTHYV